MRRGVVYPGRLSSQESDGGGPGGSMAGSRASEREGTTRESVVGDARVPLDFPQLSSASARSEGSLTRPRENCCQKFARGLRIVLPHVGLVVLLVVYTVVGAGLFHIIELPHEVKMRQEKLDSLWQMHDELAGFLWNATQMANLTEAEWREELFRGLNRIEESVIQSVDARHIELPDIRNQSRIIWTFPASIFFASTVITTIGYGHMVPQTMYGKILCIVFGLFGIPLLLITIADIGKFLSDFILLVYRTCHSVNATLKRRSAAQLMRLRKRTGLYKSVEASSVHGDSSNQEELRIPIWMVVLFLSLYTASGGYLFKMLEGWNYFDAFYFCFITMATIGFGDIVPSRQMYMFFTLIYIIIGLAITTMCIDLAGTEYIRKIHFFGQKIETARGRVAGAMASGVLVGEDVMRNLVQGKLLDARVLAMLNRRGSLNQELASQIAATIGDPNSAGAINEQLMLRLYPGLASRPGALNNILWEPLSPSVKKILKPNIKILPDEIKEDEAYILQNSMYDRPLFGPTGVITKSLRQIEATSMATWPPKERRNSDLPPFIAPFIVKESVI